MYTIEYNGSVIYDPSRCSSDYILLNPKCSKEMGMVDALDFTILPSHPFFNTFTKLQTGIVAYRDGVEIFRGRILSTSVDLYGSKNVQCEGSLAYLLDTLQPKMTYEEITCENLFRTIVANHNSQVESAKQFQVGVISHSKKNDIIEVNQTSYTETRSMIDSYLLNVKGGYLKTRVINGVQYLDWVESFERNPNQPIKVATNIIDFEEEITADDFYTVLLPLGTEKATTKDTEEEIEQDEARDHTVTIASVNGGSPYLYTSAQDVERYGYIYHMEDYGTVANATELLALANDTMTQFRKKLYRTLSIGALDLHFVDSLYDQLMVGDVVEIIAPQFSKDERLVMTKAEYDFMDPSKDKYTFGDGLQTLTRKTETGISSTNKTATKAKNDSLTNGRDLFIKKNLIDIQANNLNADIKETFSLTAQTIKLAFDQLDFEGRRVYEYSIQDAARVRGQFADSWSELTRKMSGHISPEEGLADFSAVSRIVTANGEQINTLYSALDSDQGFFNWTATSQEISNNRSDINQVKLTLNGVDGTGGLVSQVLALDNLGQKTDQVLKAAGIEVNAQTGAWMFTTDYTTGLGSYLKAESDKVGMVVTTDNEGNNHVNAGEIVLAINNQSGQSTARINANKVVISAGGVDTDLDSAIIVQNDRINLLVTQDSQGHDVVNPAYIVAAINSQTGQSQIKINADQLNLSGFVETEIARITSLTTRNILATGTISTSNSTGMLSPDFIITTSGESGYSLKDAVKDVQIVSAGNNTYKLQKQTYRDPTWQDCNVTFSRATTLSGSWNGSGSFTVTASPQGNSLSTTINSLNPNNVSWNGNTASIPIYAVIGDSADIYTGKTYTINASERYTAGQTAAGLTYDVTQHKISRSLTSSTKSYTMSVEGDAGEFNGELMAIPVTIRALIDGSAVIAVGTLDVECEPRGAYSNGYSDGTRAGSSAAWQEGYNTGYEAGVASADQYTYEKLYNCKANVTYAGHGLRILYYKDDNDNYRPAGDTRAHYWYWSNTRATPEVLYRRTEV